MKLKRLAAAVLCLPVLTGTCGAIGLVVDGQQLVLDVEPQVVQQRTLVPLRAIFEELGATVTWDQATQTARAVKGSDTVQITLNSTTAYVNGEAQTLDVPAMAIDGRTLVPVRFVSEALDAQVDWLQDTQTVRITTADYQGSSTPQQPTTLGEKNALSKAHSYLDFMAFSYSGLVDQLEFEGFTSAEATFAADNCGANWNEQALEKAKDYLDVMAFSRKGLLDQLEFEGFTSAQSEYAVNNCGANWNEQAAKKAQDYLDVMAFSRQGLLDQLEFEGFTPEQAEYGVQAVGY